VQGFVTVRSAGRSSEIWGIRSTASTGRPRSTRRRTGWGCALPRGWEHSRGRPEVPT